MIVIAMINQMVRRLSRGQTVSHTRYERSRHNPRLLLAELKLGAKS